MQAWLVPAVLLHQLVNAVTHQGQGAVQGGGRRQAVVGGGEVVPGGRGDRIGAPQVLARRLAYDLTGLPQAASDPKSQTQNPQSQIDALLAAPLAFLALGALSWI